MKMIRMMVMVLALCWLALPARAAGPVYELRVDGLSCPFCAYGIEKRLNQLEGVAGLDTRVEDGIVEVIMEEGESLERSEAEAAVDEAGFTLGGFAERDQEDAGEQ